MFTDTTSRDGVVPAVDDSVSHETAGETVAVQLRPLPRPPASAFELIVTVCDAGLGSPTAAANDSGVGATERAGCNGADAELSRATLSSESASSLSLWS